MAGSGSASTTVAAARRHHRWVPLAAGPEAQPLLEADPPDLARVDQEPLVVGAFEDADAVHLALKTFAEPERRILSCSPRGALPNGAPPSCVRSRAVGIGSTLGSHGSCLNLQAGSFAAGR